jgi:hypothetical protein
MINFLDIRFTNIPWPTAGPIKNTDCLIRLRLNTLSARVLWRTAGMKGKVNRAEARQSVGGLGYDAIPL